jgi:hypothetical protein
LAGYQGMAKLPCFTRRNASMVLFFFGPSLKPKEDNGSMETGDRDIQVSYNR